MSPESGLPMPRRDTRTIPAAIEDGQGMIRKSCEARDPIGSR
jgi:hypothetical protein